MAQAAVRAAMLASVAAACAKRLFASLILRSPSCRIRYRRSAMNRLASKAMKGEWVASRKIEELIGGERVRALVRARREAVVRPRAQSSPRGCCSLLAGYYAKCGARWTLLVGRAYW